MSNVELKHIQNEFEHNDITVLCTTIESVTLANINKTAYKRINAFYKHRVKQYLSLIKRKLFVTAVDDYENAIITSAVFKPVEANVTVTITYEDERILSIFEDFRIVRNGKLSIVRSSQTWNLRNGWLVDLRDLIPDIRGRRRLLTDIAISVAQRSEGAFFENYPKLIKTKFNSSHFYITEQGITIYYAQGTIASRRAGIVTFECDVIVPVLQELSASCGTV